MSVDAETLMAYADGELDPLAARRVERAIAADPSLAAEVERHRALRARVAGGFAAVATEPVPDHLAAMLRSNVVDLPRREARSTPPRWARALALSPDGARYRPAIALRLALLDRFMAETR